MLRESESITAQRSRVRTARSGSDSATKWQRILAEAKRVWPKHTAKRLAEITGQGVRTCYRWLAGRATPSAQAILAVISALRSDFEQRGQMLEQFELEFN